MRNDIHENRWSPFSPEWYQQAFDKFISTADQLFNQDEIIAQGYQLPDSDGSKSSVFRRDAVLNNSFNEQALRETLKDIYLNSSHKLIASNHDNVHFFKWNGTMADVKFVPNTNLCEIVLPTESFIFQKSRDKYKLSQFYRKWISVTDILNNWDVFKWHCMLFLNQRIYSDYELRIDDQETTIRFRYEEFWVSENYSIFIYKFDTNSQCRVKISQELVKNQWKWKMPISYISDGRVLNSDKVIVAINKISDVNIRTDGNTNVDVMGDNLEFMKIEDGYIDLSKMSDFNRHIIISEPSQWIWMSIIVPKFFHEYPILLPTDVIYRPYQANLVPIMASMNGDHYKVMTDKDRVEYGKHMYINLDEHQGSWEDGWKNIIRPLVLADAFDEQDVDPYTKINTELEYLRDHTIKAADLIEEFREFVDNYTTDEKFLEYCNQLEAIMNAIKMAHDEFLINRRIEANAEYDHIYTEFLKLMVSIREDKIHSVWFHREHGKNQDFWGFISPLVYIPRELVDRYFVSTIISHIDRPVIWENTEGFNGKNRFRRPIDVEDFWMFEYDMENNVWRPYILDVKRHFPDVYTLTDPTEESPTPNRVFKAFFFYSDNMNVREQAGDIVRATPDWSDDVQEYVVDHGAVYRDIFMEKFYWMGVKSIYKGLVVTNYRWETIEYVIDNVSYERFNQLFLKTMDPYFKMGLATYLRSSNFEFPFDDAIAKMNESINTKFLGYKKITNFEMYLNKTWIPSYFDYITKIMDNWDWSNRLIRRPRNTFDTKRLLPTLINVQEVINASVRALNNDMDWILEQLSDNNYNMQIGYLNKLNELIKSLETNIASVLDFTTNLDLEIYSISHVNMIISMINRHNTLIEEINRQFALVFGDCDRNAVYDQKYEIVNNISDMVRSRVREYVSTIGSMIQKFDIETFMKAVNNPEFFNERTHDDDSCLIGSINRFETIWSLDIQEARNNLYRSTATLWAFYDPDKSYDADEIEKFISFVHAVSEDLLKLRDMIYQYWEDRGEKPNLNLVNHFDYAIPAIEELNTTIETYCNYRNILLDDLDMVRSMMINMEPFGLSDVENDYIIKVDDEIDKIIDNLSYIAGIHRKDEAVADHDEIIATIESWLAYIAHERAVFERIKKISGSPNSFIDMLAPYHDLLNAMVSYMETVDREFIPDTSWPTYSDIYNVEEIEIITGGFMHKVGEDVFIPNLGSYKITEVSEGIAKAESLESSGYRNTVFRDTCCQSNPYDSITNGKGMGIAIRPISSNKIRIINDQVINPYVERIKNIVFLVVRDLDTINPFNNTAVKENIKNINTVKSDWEDITSFYIPYMTDEAKTYMDGLVESMESIINSLQSFTEVREKNDVNRLLVLFDKLIIDSYKAFNSRKKITPNYLYFDNRLRVVYSDCLDFYGNGTAWNDSSVLSSLLDDIIYETNLFDRKMLKLLEADAEDTNQIRETFTQLHEMVNIIRECLIEIPEAVNVIKPHLDLINERLDNIPSNLQKDVWYNFKNAGVGEEGRNYCVGDIVEIIPELPTDIFGNEIHDQEEIVLNDVILVQITQVNENGGVIKVEPLMSYALPYQIWGSRNTRTRVGSGEGLVINAYSYEITIADSTLFLDSASDISQLPQFDQNDLFTFKFENIHDLDVAYEVFFAGKQIRDFVVRHEMTDDPHHPRSVDVIYLKANDVMDLRNSSIYLKGEHYFVYKLENLEIIDPGAGYTAGQEIVVDADQVALKLRVAKLLHGPMKGIESVEMIDNHSLFNGNDPTAEHAKVATDSLNNIDDEYNSGYYDQLTSDGIIKPATRSLDGAVYPFTSRRFDNLPDGDRNKRFMYPDVDMPDVEGAATNGDPDTHSYLGSRVDNSMHPMEDSRIWNGIVNTIPPTDPFIPDASRVPIGQPIKGEYQNIDWLRIHSTNADILDSISEQKLERLVNKKAKPNPSGEFVIHDKSIEGIPVDVIESMVEGNHVPIGTPTVVVDGETIKAVDINRIRGLIFNELTGAKNPGPYMDECLVINTPTEVINTTVQNASMISGDISVETYASMPKHINEWPDAMIGKTVIVEHDETNGGHRMLYRLRTFVVTGYLIYEFPEVADYEWNYFDVDWMKCDFYPDLPTMKAQYPSAPWREAATYRIVQNAISDGAERDVTPRAHEGTYIHDLTVDDLSVFNFTTMQWEDLHDETRWRLDVRNDDENHDWGFRLTFLESGFYSYDMRLFLNKVPETQMRNAQLKRDAIFKVTASIYDEVNKAAINMSVNTGRHLRIRKLFPYEQKESYTIGKDTTGASIGYEMNFKLANYIHFKNEIHLEDIKIYNKTAGRFEDVMDPTMFEVRFKDDRAVARGYETQTCIVKSMIATPGEGFVDGEVWGWNAEFGIHIFGHVTADFINEGSLLTFTPIHCPNPPKENISLEFSIFQYSTQAETKEAKVIIEFETQKLEVWGDGYLHNVVNRMAPVPREFKVICQYNLDGPTEYDIIISKSPRSWTFVEPRWMVFPTFHLPDCNIQQDRLYITTDKGRFPLINPSTGKPSMNVTQGPNGTDVMFLNLYNKYEHFEVHSVPYPMRSVYVQRRVPANGFIDLKGKINKPLNKKYFEFWMNGRLLFDEVTIISPTKIFLHGLKSLRNFEIIEVNRDPNEYFSDNFLEVEQSEYGRPYPVWNFNTYLDDALSGTLDGDNYTLEEQASLLAPVWKQVDKDHPEYKNYPPNLDIEDDILLRVDEYSDMSDIDSAAAYQFTVLDVPTIEGISVTGRTMTFEQFGFRPISDTMIIDMLNDEWKDEIKKGKIPVHSILSDEEWYGVAARLYDEYGVLVHTLNEAAYKIIDTNMIRININTKLSRIVHNPVIYDLD